jgi:hypothetical protein
MKSVVAHRLKGGVGGGNDVDLPLPVGNWAPSCSISCRLLARQAKRMDGEGDFNFVLVAY